MEFKKLIMKKNFKLTPSEISHKLKMPSPTLNTLQKIKIFKGTNLTFPIKPSENNNNEKNKETPTLMETIKILNSKIKKRCLSINSNKTNDNNTILKRNISMGNINKRRVSQCHSSSTFSTSNFNDSKIIDENEDLMNIEWIILSILNKYKNQSKCNDECFKWFKQFVSGKLFNLNYVHTQDTKNLCKNLIALMMFGMLVNYVFSCQNFFIENNYTLTDITIYVHKMYILLCEYYIQIIQKNDNESNKIRNQSKILFPNIESMQINDILNEMRYECNYISNAINQILLRNKNQTEDLLNFFKQIKTITLIEIYNYFLSLPRNKKNMIKSISHSNLHNQNTNKIPIPYLKYIPISKLYTLILDLDETLIHFIPQEIGNKAIIQYRPGLYQFLDNLSPYFELILWTVATKQYADPIINSIERYKNYFSCRLFREYSTFTNGAYIKNLNNLGRDLSKVIIIDDKSCSFSAQKENGILIKPYFGSDKEDDYQLIDLIPILLKIIKECSDDVRIGIKKCKFEILSKISPKKNKEQNQDSNIFIKVNK